MKQTLGTPSGQVTDGQLQGPHRGDFQNIKLGTNVYVARQVIALRAL